MRYLIRIRQMLELTARALREVRAFGCLSTKRRRRENGDKVCKGVRFGILTSVYLCANLVAWSCEGHDVYLAVLFSKAITSRRELYDLYFHFFKLLWYAPI